MQAPRGHPCARTAEDRLSLVSLEAIRLNTTSGVSEQLSGRRRSWGFVHRKPEVRYTRSAPETGQSRLIFGRRSVFLVPTLAEEPVFEILTRSGGPGLDRETRLRGRSRRQKKCKIVQIRALIALFGAQLRLIELRGGCRRPRATSAWALPPGTSASPRTPPLWPRQPVRVFEGPGPGKAVLESLRPRGRGAARAQRQEEHWGRHLVRGEPVCDADGVVRGRCLEEVGDDDHRGNHGQGRPAQGVQEPVADPIVGYPQLPGRCPWGSPRPPLLDPRSPQETPERPRVQPDSVLDQPRLGPGTAPERRRSHPRSLVVFCNLVVGESRGSTCTTWKPMSWLRAPCAAQPAHRVSGTLRKPDASSHDHPAHALPSSSDRAPWRHRPLATNADGQSPNSYHGVPAPPLHQSDHLCSSLRGLLFGDNMGRPAAGRSTCSRPVPRILNSSSGSASKLNNSFQAMCT